MIPAVRRERGAMLSLVLTLLAIGALAYFTLRGSARFAGTRPAAETNAIASAASCEHQVAMLIAKTGGQGPEYKAGSEALPASCRKLLPAASSTFDAAPPQAAEPTPDPR